MNKEQFKTSVGGQALMEGIMMRGPQQICCAVRDPQGRIKTDLRPVKPQPWAKIPFVRGTFAMIGNLAEGYRCLNYSIDISLQDEEEEKPGKLAETLMMGFSLVLGAALAIGLFTVAPTYLSGLIGRVLGLGRWAKTICEACFKLLIFVCYLALCSRLKDIHRMFEYHGAEHKTIACYEAGDSLTVENVRNYTRFHPRCGTSFLILVLLISIFLYSVLPWSNMALRVVYKLLLLPVVMGISYELLKWCGRTDNLATRIIRWPGLLVQRLTVFEPTDDMIEVAIAAVTPVLPEDPEEGKW